MQGRAALRMLLLAVLLAAAGALLYGWYDFSRFSRTPLHVTTQGDSIDIARGTSFRNIVGELRQRGLTSADPLYWWLLAEQMRVAGKLHAGEYALEAGITPRQLLTHTAGYGYNWANGVILRYLEKYELPDLIHCKRRSLDQ